MCIVCVETAKRLEADGFPKPKPALGQFWYGEVWSGNMQLWVVAVDEFGEQRFRGISKSGRDYKIELSGKFVFAPTAINIMRELPGKCLLMAGKMYIVDHPSQLNPQTAAMSTDDRLSIHAKSAEAAALEWFKTKGK